MSTADFSAKRAYTIDEFGVKYGPKRTKTYALIKQRKLVAVHCGAKTIIRHDDAEAWLDSLPAIETCKKKPGFTGRARLNFPTKGISTWLQ